jgi:hypothetical protein
MHYNSRFSFDRLLIHMYRKASSTLSPLQLAGKR